MTWIKWMCIVVPVVFLTAPWVWVYSVRPVNPWEPLGVHLEWSVGGTGAYPNLDMWWEDNGERVDGPTLGGVTHPELRFKDFDGDGIKELLFENDYQKIVVAFQPKNGSKLPRFTVVEQVNVGG